LCLRRVRRADFLTIKNSFSPDHWSSIMPGVSTYCAVQICGATSIFKPLILHRAQIASLLLLIDTHDVIGLEFIRHGAIANAGDHGSHRVALLHEVFRTDWVIKTLANDKVAELETVTGRMSGHIVNQV